MKKNERDMMFEQTIGVEVEMNNITREKAAKVVAGLFETDSFYLGTGYDTYACKDKYGRTWKFSSDSSIAGPQDERCEMITPILTYTDMDDLQAVVRALRAAGAKSSYRRGCGVHVHIGANGHTPKTLRNLTNIMASHESLLIDALAIDDYRVSSYCQPVDERFLKQVNDKKPKTMDELKNIWYCSQGCQYGMDAHYNSSRYHIMNLHATFTKGTIEFRLFQFYPRSNGKSNNLHAGLLKTYIQLCLALSNYAKVVRNARYTEPVANYENPKYVMRFWLKTLGMIGDEFKTAREFLTERLEGNSDCRCGNRENCTHRAA